MVHIKKVEIFGFKSFGFKNTVVDFQPGLITISGPNGSGKSNILNAIIFAMGENKPRVMGVDKLRSLIHEVGGPHRGIKIARSSIHFDNTDRRIPISADTVEITREMDDKGDNTYYVNKKKTQRTGVLNLLDTANAGLNQLNALQQGTVTRIAESSPEEKRMAIEDLVGLSYFDEKKEESKKQLTDADHRLELALTRMDEVKKNIDDLEEARNIYLRHGVLEAEIARLNAIDAARSLKIVTSEIAEKRSESEALAEQMRLKRAEKDGLAAEIKGIEEEKSKFMADAEAFNSAKAEVDSNIGRAIRESTEAQAAAAVALHRIEQITSKVPEIDHELRINVETYKTVSEKLESLRGALARANSHKSSISEEITSNNAQLTDIFDRHAEQVARIRSADNQAKELNTKRTKDALDVSRLETESSANGARLSVNRSRQGVMESSVRDLRGASASLERHLAGYVKAKAVLQSKIGAFTSRKAQIQKEIGDLDEILEKSQNATSQCKAKLKMIRDIMHEDYSIAQLREHAREIGIAGFAYEMLSWDSRYERAALAAGSEWLKAIVTKDIATMVSLSEYVRSKKLPKLKIVSLGGIASSAEVGGGLDMLANHIICKDEHKPLASFLFENVVIAGSAQDARKLANLGYRAVTLGGELVEPGSKAIIIDTNSKISKLTRIIANAATLEGLVQSILLLRKFRDRKRAAHQRAEDALRRSRDRIAENESSITTTSDTLSSLASRIGNAEKNVARFGEQNEKLAKRNEYVTGEIGRLDSRIGELDTQIAAIETGTDSPGIRSEMDRLKSLNASLELENEGALAGCNEASSNVSKAEAELERITGDRTRLEKERTGLAGERESLDRQAAEKGAIHKERELELAEMRQSEQSIISTRGASMSKIGEYDSKLDSLRTHERTTDRALGAHERNDDSLRRDLAELGARESSLKRACSSLDSIEGAEGVDVKRLLVSLREEREAVTNFNTAAPARYLEISTGYRSMSTKKNALESERNKIIKFIEDVERDKRQKFLDAFNIVDTEVGSVFSKMTGGDARLELLDEDDIFNSGISYTIRFPNKTTKRDSAAISGGEKSLAAVVFVLALQKLNPSPFYLFDEVDAHLDAPNSEKLVKILKERAADSQFILVSLKDSIIKEADLVYGVYPRAGVSQVVTYKDKHVPKISS